MSALVHLALYGLGTWFGSGVSRVLAGWCGVLNSVLVVAGSG